MAPTPDGAGSGVVTHTTGPEPSIETSVLGNGIRIVTERMPEARSVSVGIYVGVGSRDEPSELAGSSHFLEHLLFKGTEERSARSIAMAVDAVGGEMNAFTTRENTAFYTRLPADELDFGLDLLADVVANPAFREHEIDAEREVILEELFMAEDTPDDVLHMELLDAVFPEHGLGRETLGSRDTIESLGRDEIASFHREWYTAANLVVAAAGDLHHDTVVESVAASLGSAATGTRPRRTAPERPLEPLVVVERPNEQVHVSFAWHAFAHDDPDRYAFYVANNVLGGSMSSRLFQEIREKRGLAYSVYSSLSMYSDTGFVSVYAGTSPKNLAEVLDVLDDTIDEILRDGITEEEHRVAVGFLEGSMLLGLEDSGSRMGRIGGSLLARDEITSLDEHLARIRAVTRDQALAVLHRVFDTPRTVAAVGPFTADEPALQTAVARRRG